MRKQGLRYYTILRFVKRYHRSEVPKRFLRGSSIRLKDPVAAAFPGTPFHLCLNGTWPGRSTRQRSDRAQTVRPDTSKTPDYDEPISRCSTQSQLPSHELVPLDEMNEL
jgi:hypothetical protein